MIGNERVHRYLERLVVSGYVGHTLLFSGPRGVGKSLFAREFATRLLLGEGKSDRPVERHPDFHLYRPSGRSGLHSIQAMRRLAEEVAMRPNETPWSLFVIDDADRMLPTSSNALLKTFEEPPPHALIILISSARESLLPTVLSRCRTLFFEPVGERDLVSFVQERSKELSRAEAERIAREARGSVARALHLLEGGESVIYRRLLTALASGELLGDYVAIHRLAEELSNALEGERKERERRMRDETLAEFPEATASQRDILAREVEGVASLAFYREVDELLAEYLGWYRDRHLLARGGDRALLWHPSYDQELRTCKAPLPSLEGVQQGVREARQAVQRNIRLSAVLEALFLQT